LPTIDAGTTDEGKEERFSVVPGEMARAVEIIVIQ
jgi:hypothetical protein